MHDSEQNPLRSISILYRKSHIWLNSGCAEYRLTAPQTSVILLLCDFGAMTQEELTRCLSLDKSVIAKTVTKMEERGLLSRTTNARDKRTYDIRPTKQAWEVYPLIKAQVHSCFVHMTRQMTEQEREEFQRLLLLAAQASIGQEEGKA